jgi:hypothetical protein
LWLAGAAFRLEKSERHVVGLALGLALESLFANLLARLIALPAALWIAAGLTALIGFLSAWRAARNGTPGGLWPLPLAPLPVFSMGGLTLLMFGLGRGTAIFDDFAHLPTVSVMAAGNFPPRFVLNPDIPFYYHYFIDFIAAQLMRAGGLSPWNALDLSRALAAALAVCLAFYWSRRLTRSSSGGLFGAAVLLFASGARWLLLLLPGGVLRAISDQVTLIGSGAGSGVNLATALTSPWAVEGAGPFPLPFAFANGVQASGILLQFVTNGMNESVFLLALLLVATRRRGRLGSLAAAILFSPLTLLTEAGIVLSIAALGLLGLLTAWRQRSVKLPRTFWDWIAICLGGYLLGVWQGGALWGIALRFLGLASAEGYNTIGFGLVFPPTLVSAHLGVLSLANPAQLFAALAELGPLPLILPLVIIWGWKAARAQRWFEAALAAEAFLGLFILFVQFTGSEGVRNTTRMYRFPLILTLTAAPLAWNWLRNRRPAWRWLGASLAGGSLLGGLALFAVLLPALQKPVYSYFITGMDARMYEQSWNRLEEGARVFDFMPYRAPAVLGRATNANLTWYKPKPEWEALTRNPLPSALRAAGFSYAYLDQANFAALDGALQAAWQDPCLRLEAEASKDESWRRLYDVRSCR